MIIVTKAGIFSPITKIVSKALSTLLKEPIKIPKNTPKLIAIEKAINTLVKVIKRCSSNSPSNKWNKRLLNTSMAVGKVSDAINIANTCHEIKKKT